MSMSMSMCSVFTRYRPWNVKCAAELSMLLDFAKLELDPGQGRRVVSGSSSSSSSSRMHFF